MACLQGMMQLVMMQRQIVFFGGGHEEKTLATNQMCSIKWLVHILDPAGCWNHPNMLQLGWRVLMPASSQAVSLALGPEGRAPGWMGPVTDTLIPRWLTQSAGCTSKWAAPWWQATMNPPSSTCFPPPRHLWSTWRDERVVHAHWLGWGFLWYTSILKFVSA